MKQKKNALNKDDIMRCANCKFFKMGYFEHNISVFQPEGGCHLEESDNPELGICLHEKIVSDYKDGWLKTNTKTPPDDGIYATCDEGRGHLIVGKNFGCIHFEYIVPVRIINN